MAKVDMLGRGEQVMIRTMWVKIIQHFFAEQQCCLCTPLLSKYSLAFCIQFKAGSFAGHAETKKGPAISGEALLKESLQTRLGHVHRGTARGVPGTREK